MSLPSFLCSFSKRRFLHRGLCGLVIFRPVNRGASYYGKAQVIHSQAKVWLTGEDTLQSTANNQNSHWKTRIDIRVSLICIWFMYENPLSTIIIIMIGNLWRPITWEPRALTKQISMSHPHTHTPTNTPTHPHPHHSTITDKKDLLHLNSNVFNNVCPGAQKIQTQEVIHSVTSKIWFTVMIHVHVRSKWIHIQKISWMKWEVEIRKMKH